jgi:hypothetical protein
LGLSGRLGHDVAGAREDSPEPCSGLRGNLLVGHPVIDEIDDGHLRVARRITREPNTIWRVCQRSSRLGSHHFVMMGGMSNSAPGIGDDSARCDACGGPVVEIVFGMPTYELFEAVQRGEVVLGGCTLPLPGDPTHSCACGETIEDRSDHC